MTGEIDLVRALAMHFERRQHKVNTEVGLAPVIDYVIEEVWRQGHDVSDLDGIERVGWMLNGWCYALHWSNRQPDITDVAKLGRLVEPEKNYGGLRQCGVRVGMHRCPEWRQVPKLLTGLFALRNVGGQIIERPPLDFYKEFELIHPFEDGNGRTGKILFNWLAGSLLRPVFPPEDLWGRPIRNP